MLRQRHLGTATLALGLVVLTDVLRVFLPSVITIFGQAASTPAELLGAFALGWFVLALAAPPLVRLVGSHVVGVVAVALLGVARLALTAGPGGAVQLWLAGVGLLAGLVWLAATATRGARAVPGLALGLAAAALGHVLVGTYDLAWRGSWAAWAASGVMVVALLAGEIQLARRSAVAGPVPDGRAWLLVGPASVLAGMVALSPAVVGTATSYWFGAPGTASTPLFAFAPLGVALAVFLLAALTPSRPRARLVWPVLLLVGALLFGYGPPSLLTVAVLLSATGLGGCLALADGVAGPSARSATRRGYAAVGGMLVFAVVSVLYYAAYDLGYPNGWLPALVAALTGLIALEGRLRPGPVTAPATGDLGAPAAAPAAGEPTTFARLPRVPIAVLAALTAFAAAVVHEPWPVATNRPGPPEQIRVVAYNIRMGFGMDGRFDLPALERAVREADVVVLSEVDRGWLLNGGHDTLHLFSDRLGLPYVFAPAADTLWGDAVLSRWPVDRARTRALPAVGAPTGAQALGVTVDFSEGVRLAVVSTHLQPPPGADPVVQARAVAEFATGYADGLPLVVAGDFNTEPGDPAFTALTDAGLVDAFAAARPVPTSPADDPRAQIDHVFVSPDLVASDAVATPGTASDHLPVAVTLTLPGGAG
ncbi:endonuclease/exonuclease/phosphatase family protein [Verrucosispora sp. TAA-831]|uniref:endonuclease/exonuclease/phosphatase family protein n=1 Tax=Verrucosispora sp. TAA-831 TaxID=3422227 RepID=UPI003D6F524E